MGDLDVRDLERRWRATGEAADEGALLVERLRAGALDVDLVRLAASCDHPAARLVAPPLPGDDLGTWGATANRLPLPTRAAIAMDLARAALAAGHLATERVEDWSAATSVGRRLLEGSFDPANEDHVFERAVAKVQFLRPVEPEPEEPADVALRSALDWVTSAPDLVAVDLAPALQPMVDVLGLDRVAAALAPHVVEALHDAIARDRQP